MIQSASLKYAISSLNTLALISSVLAVASSNVYCA